MHQFMEDMSTFIYLLTKYEVGLFCISMDQARVLAYFRFIIKIVIDINEEIRLLFLLNYSHLKMS